MFYYHHCNDEGKLPYKQNYLIKGFAMYNIFKKASVNIL